MRLISWLIGRWERKSGKEASGCRRRLKTIAVAVERALCWSRFMMLLHGSTLVITIGILLNLFTVIDMTQVMNYMSAITAGLFSLLMIFIIILLVRKSMNLSKSKSKSTSVVSPKQSSPKAIRMIKKATVV
jgi:type VI protein secretion system component VasK